MLPDRSHRHRRGFERLRIYQAALEAAVHLAAALKDMPQHEEQQGLIADLLRASRLVWSRISTAFALRSHPELCIRHLATARTQAAETMVFIEIGNKLGYFTRQQADEFRDRYDELSRRLGAILDRWRRKFPSDDPFRSKDDDEY